MAYRAAADDQSARCRRVMGGCSGGDIVLAQTAQRLLHLVRSHDTAARLAGDEFVLLLRHIPPDWHGQQFLDRARRELSHPVSVDEKALPISASLGLIVANPRGGPDRDRDVAAVLAAADHAMYLAKAAR